jgi:hypothetical protein
MHLLSPYGVPFPRLAGYRAFSVMGLVLTSAYLCMHLRASLRRARFLLLVACFLVMQLAVSFGWAVQSLPLLAAALLLSALGTVTAELAAAFLLFAATPAATFGPTTALALWAAVLLRFRHAGWAAIAAPLAAAAWCTGALLFAPSLCELPSLGIGLFCAAAALEGSR